MQDKVFGLCTGGLQPLVFNWPYLSGRTATAELTKHFQEHECSSLYCIFEVKISHLFIFWKMSGSLIARVQKFPSSIVVFHLVYVVKRTASCFVKNSYCNKIQCKIEVTFGSTFFFENFLFWEIGLQSCWLFDQELT